MGIALWVVTSVAAFLFARMAPWRRRHAYGHRIHGIGELSVSITAGVVLGAVATALDFGGWSEPDWRAGLFVFLGALAAAGVFRLTIAEPPGDPS
jgi:hypothetical protein